MTNEDKLSDDRAGHSKLRAVMIEADHTRSITRGSTSARRGRSAIDRSAP